MCTAECGIYSVCELTSTGCGITIVTCQSIIAGDVGEDGHLYFAVDTGNPMYPGERSRNDNSSTGYQVDKNDSEQRTSTSAEEQADNDFVLKCAPNPTSGATTVSYVLSEATQVRLELYNAIGQRIGVLEEGDRQQGQHIVPLDMQQYASGYYNLRLTVNGHVYSIKLLNRK